MSLLKKINNRLLNQWLTFRYFHIANSKFEVNPENVMIISGDPRGGTTWLAELINGLPQTAMIWEPLAISKVRQFRNLGFQWRQFIAECDEWPEARVEFENLFSGKILNPYLCQRTTPGELTDAQHLLVKFCRANQLLPWLTKEFKFRFSPIYLVRHPCAVVASQIKQGGWDHVKPIFEIPEGRYLSFYTDHADFLKTIDTVEKRLAAMWCLCNQVPLMHPENNKRWITITYESMLLNGKDQLKRIEERWAMKFPDEIYNQVFQASATTVSGSPITEGKAMEQLRYWKKNLNSKQIENILAVLDYFNVKVYDGDELPRISFQD